MNTVGEGFDPPGGKRFRYSQHFGEIEPRTREGQDPPLQQQRNVFETFKHQFVWLRWGFYAVCAPVIFYYSTYEREKEEVFRNFFAPPA